MKKFLPYVIISLAFFTAKAQIPNGGFENWTTVGAYENPDNWGTLNNTTATYSVFTATKATPGNPGNAYLKLTSRTTGTMVTPGIAVCGKLDTVSMMPKSGFIYTSRSASFGGKWQHMIYGNSQGSIMVVLSKWNAGLGRRDTIAHGTSVLSGMAMSWANFSFNLTYLDSLRYPDSCLLVLRASGSAPTNNDYLWVDNLAFSGTVALAPPPNLVALNKNKNEIQVMRIFPIPSKEAITVEFVLNTSAVPVFEIYDLNGKLLKHLDIQNAKVGSNNFYIETSTFNKGVYSLVLKNDTQITRTKFLIE